MTKCNSILARDQAGDFFLVIIGNSVVACDQAGDVLLWSNVTPCLRCPGVSVRPLQLA